MQMEFQQSESIAERRRWILVLVDSTDGVTGKTGQSGTVFISKNGGAGTASTNSLVEVDAGDMPGHYYIELTAAELDTLGMISIYYKAAGTLAFHDRGFVTYNNPYQSQGGFAVAGDSKGSGLKREQVEDLLKKIRKIIAEEVAKIEPAKMPDIKMPDYSKVLAEIRKAIPKETDLSDVLSAIAALEKPKDYSKELSKIAVQINAFGNAHKLDVSDFIAATKSFEKKMTLASDSINASVTDVTKIKAGFEELEKIMETFKGTLAEQSDMDKRFEAMTDASMNTKMEGMIREFKQMLVKLTTLLYDLKLEKLKD